MLQRLQLQFCTDKLLEQVHITPHNTIVRTVHVLRYRPCLL